MEIQNRRKIGWETSGSRVGVCVADPLPSRRMSSGIVPNSDRVTSEKSLLEQAVARERRIAWGTDGNVFGHKSLGRS